MRRPAGCPYSSGLVGHWNIQSLTFERSTVLRSIHNSVAFHSSCIMRASIVYCRQPFTSCSRRDRLDWVRTVKTELIGVGCGAWTSRHRWRYRAWVPIGSPGLNPIAHGEENESDALPHVLHLPNPCCWSPVKQVEFFGNEKARRRSESLGVKKRARIGR